jgi:hypothetical protein
MHDDPHDHHAQREHREHIIVIGLHEALVERLRR